MAKIQHITFLSKFLYGLCILVLCYATYAWFTASDITWDEGHIQASPNKKWSVFLQSGHRSKNEPFIQVSLFDTVKYPSLKKPGIFPNRFQENNPTARYLLPIPMFARATDFQWAKNHSHVILRQPELNLMKPIEYKLDFSTFSLTKINANPNINTTQPGQPTNNSWSSP